MEQTINAWICDNSDSLKRRLSNYATIDEDAFQDTYLSLVAEYPKPESGSTFEKAFMEIYRRIAKKHFREIFETSHPDELFFSLLPSGDSEPMDQPDEPQDRKPIAKKIQKHIRSTFPQPDVTAFEMRIKGFSYRDITDTLGMGATAINSITERIIKQTRLQFAAVAL